MTNEEKAWILKQIKIAKDELRSELLSLNLLYTSQKIDLKEESSKIKNNLELTTSQTMNNTTEIINNTDAILELAEIVGGAE